MKWNTVQSVAPQDDVSSSPVLTMPCETYQHAIDHMYALARYEAKAGRTLRAASFNICARILERACLNVAEQNEAALEEYFKKGGSQYSKSDKENAHGWFMAGMQMQRRKMNKLRYTPIEPGRCLFGRKYHRWKKSLLPDTQHCMFCGLPRKT